MAIMQYLCEKYDTRECYPRDAKERATISAFMNWHQTNTRLSASRITWHALIPGIIGGKLDLNVASENLRLLKRHLRTLNDVLLCGPGDFLGGRTKWSCVDLLVAEDIVNLHLLKGSSFHRELGSIDSILAPFHKVLRWIEQLERVDEKK